MKKALKSIAFALLSAAMLFNFAACSSDDDDSDSGSGGDSPSVKPATLPQVEGPNPLSGSTFEDKEDSGDYTIYKFGSDTYTVTGEHSTIEYNLNVDVLEKSEITYKYVVDSANSMIYSAKTSSKFTYLDAKGKTIYTAPSSTPSTFTEWKKEQIKYYKALAKGLLEYGVPDTVLEKIVQSELYSTFALYGYEDISCNTPVSDEVYKNYLTKMNLQDYVSEIAFSLEGDSLKIYGIDSSVKNKFPKGIKIDNIFNDYYNCYISNYSPSITFRVNKETLSDRQINITLDAEKDYKILSAQADKLEITEITNVTKSNSYHSVITGIEYNPNNKIEVPVTYEEGENKIVAKLVIEGKEYTLDIDYITKEFAEGKLKFNGKTFTKK